MALDIVIRNENDAWRYLKRALEGDPELEGPIDLKFVGWPTLDLHFKGHDFDQSVPTRIMPPLLGAQKEVQRLYCQVRYGQQNLQKLTNDDRDRLELVVKVDKGSSQYLTNLDDVLTETARAAIAGMDSIHILIALISGALIWGSNVAWKRWLDSQAQDKDVASRVRMSQLEHDKLKLLTDALNRSAVAKDHADGVDQFRNNSLNKLKPADSFTLPGTRDVIDGEYAAEITHKQREQSTEIRIDGEFIIQAVSSGEIRGFRVKVKRVLDGKIINVTIPDGAITEAQKEILKNNEWAKRPVVMEINAKELRGEIASATLVSTSDIHRQQ